MSAFLHDPHTIAAIHGALTGWVGAAAVDLHAFMTWTSVNDVKQWNWRLALLRWAQGLIGGAISGAGLSALVG